MPDDGVHFRVGCFAVTRKIEVLDPGIWFPHAGSGAQAASIDICMIENIMEIQQGGYPSCDPKDLPT